ncbi:MAG: tetratricopeptide (TPR) repeat protein [Polyangiales bacterium]|jgi:tetratricopeptide (TPR) repeat protein
MSDFRRALAFAKEGQLSQGYSLVRGHLSKGETVILEAAPLLVALRRTREALELLDGLGSPLAARLAAELCFRAGLETEGIARLQAMGPVDPERSAKVAAARLRARDYENLVSQPHVSPSMRLAALVGLSRHEEARGLAQDDAERALTGDFPEPQRTLRLGVLTHGSTPVEAMARGFVAYDASAMRTSARAWRAQDLGPLEEAEVLVWEAEAALLDADEGEAYRCLDAALAKAGRVHLPALLLRLSLEMRGDLERVAAGEVRREQTTEGGALHLASEIREALQKVWKRDRFVGADLKEVVRILDESVARLGFHRSPNTTFTTNAGYEPVFAASPRQDSRRQLERIRVLSADAVREGLIALQTRWPISESPLVHQGELELWLGHYEEACALFRAALARAHGTRWAYIGLGGAQMLMGQLEEALETQDEGVRVLGSEVGSLFVYRGEARRRCGHPGALSDLLKAHEAHPARLGAWLNLALLDHERARQIERLIDFTPLLVEEVLGPLGFEERKWSDEQLTALLAALHGNRSSSCITFQPPGAASLQTVPRPRLSEPGTYEERRSWLLRGLSRRWARRDMSVP